jgi:hypothetical protein
MLLSRQDMQGGFMWRPGLEDWNALPEWTILLFDAIVDGLRAQNAPWSWWKPVGARSYAHQYAASPSGVPEGPARCGFDPGVVDRWEAGEARLGCKRCLALARKDAPSVIELEQED